MKNEKKKDASKENVQLDSFAQCFGGELPKQCNDFDYKEQGQDHIGE